MAWFVYNIGPIDQFWEFLPTLDEVRKMLRDHDNMYALELGEAVLPEFEKNFHSARVLARDGGWQGDELGEVHVFWLPADTDFQYAFVWKQSSKGSTFVVAPFPLDYLKALTGASYRDVVTSLD